ncbi:MAG: lysine 2,3-aminomutase [Desulfobacteraceae bacterium]|nr:lysine 2,3-aminomutase [Desulfobacteraceae bacterium]
MSEHEFKAYNKKSLNKIKYLDRIDPEIKKDIEICTNIIPFRVSSYVIDELIDWDKVPDDPIFQMTFPQPGMIGTEKFNKLKFLYLNGQNEDFNTEVRNIHFAMNPHPAGQKDMNIPVMDNRTLPGMQHKYDETVLFFPSQGQLCHSFCTYCFRWAQFIGLQDLKFSSREKESLYRYITINPLITDLLFTGGDPMVMKASVIEKYVEPFIQQKPDHLQNIRFGTKALAYWPYRFFDDKDSDELMRLFEKIVDKGYHLAVMAHFSHYRELETPAVEKAVKRLRSVGAQIRCQAPLIKNINDKSIVWEKMWKDQVKLGAVPYYFFVERDTGPKNYFEVPLVKALEIFTNAYRNVSGLARTVRGPSMSAGPGKILLEDINEINGEKVFVLKFVQSRIKEFVNKVFFAKYNENASWIDDLEPAFGEKEFFYEKRYSELRNNKINILKNCVK